MIRILLLIVSSILLATVLAPAHARQPELFVPVFSIDFPDPFVIEHDGRFLAYATNARAFAANVQMAESSDLTAWQPVRDASGQLYDAMPVLPAWAKAGRTWAPEVIAAGGAYVLYFTAQEARGGRQCVGVATSASPRGPFVSTAVEPLVCQRELGGTIDPSPFRDADGSLHLLYKSDGNNPAVLKPSQLWSQPLTPDGLALAGAATMLLQNDQHWEWRVVESPTMVRDPGGGYTLFYSANHYGWETDQRLSNYGVGYARCASVAGPCVKAPENPILRSYNTSAEGCLSGPGHQTVLEARGRQFMVFHAWSARGGCRPADKGRYMYVAPLGWSGDTPQIGVSLRATK